MSPQEMKELPNDEQDDQNLIGVLISDDEDIAGDEPEPPDPDVDVEVEEVDDVPQEAVEGHADDEEDEEGEDEDEEVEEEEDVDDDEDEDSSEGRKEEDDDSDDEDEDDDKRPFNDSDDEDEDDDDDDNDEDSDEGGGGAGGYSAVGKACISVKKNTFSKGKVMPGASFPLTANQGYKGDIEDLIRAAAQAEEGETSGGQDQVDDIDCQHHEDHSLHKITIKVTTEEIECEVVDVIEVENDTEELQDRDEEELDSNFCDIEKGLLLKETHSVGDDEDPPHKRIKNS